jgi:hypothetical protein
MTEEIVENIPINELIATELLPQPVFSAKNIPENIFPYFNQEWNKILFENPIKPSEVFNFKLPDEGENIYIDNKNLTNPTFDTTYMENNFANKLQFYYNYLDINPQLEEKTIEGKTCKNLLALSPFYVQTIERLLMVMIFIHLDQCHDFLDSGRGATKYTLNENIYTDYDDLIKSFDYGDLIPNDDSLKIYTGSKSSETALERYGEPKSPDVSINVLILDNPCNNPWHQMSIRTSFCGGLSNYGIFLLEDTSYRLLKSLNFINENDEISSDYLTELLKKLPTIFVFEENGIYPKSNGGTSGFVLSLDETGEVKVKDDGTIMKPENVDTEQFIVRFLPFVSKNYDDGMHILWEFNSLKHIYIVKLKQLKVQKYISYSKQLESVEKEDPMNSGKKIKEKIGVDIPDKENYRVYDPIYEASKFVTLDLIIPQQNIETRPIFQKIVGSTEREMKSVCDFILNKYDDSQEEERNIAKEKYDKLISEVKNQVFVNSIQSLMRGVNYTINVPERTNYSNIIFNNILKILFKTNLASTDKLFVPGESIYESKRNILKNSYDIVDNNAGLILETVDLIKNAENGENVSEMENENNPPFVKNVTPETSNNVLFNKQFAVINDTAAIPKEAYYITAMNNVDAEYDSKYDIKYVNYPYKFTIVSGTTDGSGQGGQITPTYHPPELDIYMPIFDEMTGELRGCIMRICFLSKINENRLNMVNKGIVENHFIYIDLVDDTGSSYTNDVSLYQERMDIILKYALSNSYLFDENSNVSNFVLLKGDGTNKKWYKYIGDDGLKVLTLNEYSNHLYSLFRIYKGTTIKIDKDVSELSTIFSKSSTEYCMLKQLHNVAVKLYNEDASLRNGISPQMVDFSILKRTLDNFDNEIMNNPSTLRNFVFELGFILRNKYDGDKSRGTDTMFYNKSGFIEGFQITNDHNAFSSANIFSFDSLLVGSIYSTFYFAPYVNNDNKIPISNSIYKETLLDGVSSTVAQLKNVSYCDIMNSVKRQLLYTVPKIPKKDSDKQGLVFGKEPRELRSSSRSARTTGEAVSISATSIKTSTPVSTEETVSAKAPTARKKKEVATASSEGLAFNRPSDRKKKAVPATTTTPSETSPLEEPTQEAFMGGERMIEDVIIPNKIDSNFGLAKGIDLKMQLEKQTQMAISTRKDCEELYKASLIRTLRYNSEIMKNMGEKYDDFLINNQPNREKIENFIDFKIMLTLLDVKNAMFFYFIPKVTSESIMNVFDTISEKSSIDSLVSLKNKYLFVFERYDEINYIDKTGLSFFDYTLPVFTSQNQKYKYLPYYFLQWTKNVKNELLLVQKYVSDYVELNPSFKKSFVTFDNKFVVLAKIFTYLRENYMMVNENIELLNKIFPDVPDKKDLYSIEELYIICLFFINVSNELKNEITQMMIGKIFDEPLNIPFSNEEIIPNEYLNYTDDSIDYNNNKVLKFSNLHQITSFLSSNSNPIPNYLIAMMNFRFDHTVSNNTDEFVQSLFEQLINYFKSQEKNLSNEDNNIFKECGYGLLYKIYLQYSFLEDVLLEYQMYLTPTEKKALQLEGGKTIKYKRKNVKHTRRKHNGNKKGKMSRREKKYKNKKYTRK